MLVYADQSERADVRRTLDRLSEELAGIAAMPAGLDRHARLVGALIEAGQLLQAVADANLRGAGELNLFVFELASAMVRSWDSRFDEIGGLPQVPRINVEGEVELRLPEGFAFYAVYPEAYADAARRLRLVGSPRVIGIRSIGTTLGAVVAAALSAPPSVTVRPFGDPFARQVELLAEVDAGAHYVIVDEGPGLSGSSFGAVADQLETRGVPLERIAFLPSHDGELGERASEVHRARWRAAQRVPAEFDPSFLEERFGAIEPFATGSPWERLKFRGTAHGEPLLIKYAGLGSIGERKLEMGRVLHAAGLTPEPLGLLHGFLVERWCERARPLAPDEKPVREIGRYIGARARVLPAASDSGASTEQLLAMARRNVSLALGEGAAREIDRWDPRIQDLQRSVVRVRTDNKLDRAEWLRAVDGRLIKTDALDHHQGHDLIGCQDAAWDVAGAIVEFDLRHEEGEQLIAATRLPIDPSLLEFCRLAYCSFRLGQAVLGGLDGDAERYAGELKLLLHPCLQGATRRESSVGGRAERTA